MRAFPSLRPVRIGALLAALGAATGARALLDPKDPNVTLYARPPQGTPAAPPTANPTLPQVDADGFWRIDFGFLASFSYGHLRLDDETGMDGTSRPIRGLLRPSSAGVIDPPTEPGTGGPIPERVTALDGKKVRLRGYMLPIKVEGGMTSQFLILRNQMMCCYGLPPAPNEWVVVRMKQKGVRSQMDLPLYFYGTLRVREIFENQVFLGLYELDVEKVTNG